MSYALQTLLHEKSRYAAGVGAVTFSAVLIALQVGLMLGLFELTSVPVDRTSADLWVGSKDLLSVDMGEAIPVSYMARLDKPGVQMPELLYLWFANWQKPEGGKDLCMIIGSRLGPDAAGCADVITPEMQAALTEPMSIVMDQSDMKRMGLKQVGDTATINGKKVRLVATVRGLMSLAAPWVFCSQSTARDLLNPVTPPDRVTYLLARCDSKQRAKEVAVELRREYPDMSTFTAEEFSTESRLYWLRRTKGGVAIGYAALLGLLVALITAQTLYAATMASAKEFATLLALGIPRSRIYGMVLSQSFWVGIIGVLFAYPVVLLLAEVASAAGTKVDLRWQVLAGAAGVTLVTALLAGLFALRSVRRIEPMNLLR